MQKRACRSHINGSRLSVPVRSGSIEAFVYNQKNAHPGYLIVEVHGGGFMYNTAADDDDLCQAIHEMLEIPVIACDYRPAPAFPFPTGIQDVFDSVKYALTLPELKASPDKIILWGHSAGANLAAAAAYLASLSDDFSPCMQILDYPYMDPYRKASQRVPIRYSVSGKMMDTFAHYYTENPRILEDILISPVLKPSGFFRELPETFILLCGCDNLNQGGKEYGKLLEEAGVPVSFHYVKQALHGFIENHYNYPYIPFLTKLTISKEQRELAERSVKRICGWILERLEA